MVHPASGPAVCDGYVDFFSLRSCILFPCSVLAPLPCPPPLACLPACCVHGRPSACAWLPPSNHARHLPPSTDPAFNTGCCGGDLPALVLPGIKLLVMVNGASATLPCPVPHSKSGGVRCTWHLLPGKGTRGMGLPDTSATRPLIRPPACHAEQHVPRAAVAAWGVPTRCVPQPDPAPVSSARGWCWHTGCCRSRLSTHCIRGGLQ